MRKAFWIPVFSLISICVGCLSCSEAARGLEPDALPFGTYMTYYLLATDYLEEIERIPAFFAIFPILAFLFFNGTYLYNKWSDTGIFIITRKKHRVTALLQDALRLAGMSVIGGIIYLSVPLLYAGIILKQSFEWYGAIGIKLFVTTFALIYCFAMIQNLISMMHGSSYGIIIGTILFLTLASASMSMLHGVNATALKILSFVIPFLPFYESPLDRFTLSLTVLSSAFSCILVTVIGAVLVKRTDIGLSNKEFI